MSDATRPNIVRRLYDWVIHWAATPWAIPALALLSFSEASFFPIPPDVLLIAMAMAAPKRAFYFAAVCSVASVGGGMLGYYIGVALMGVVGCQVVSLYHGQSTFDWLATQFAQYDFWAVFVAAVTPIPYKIFTITAGAVGADLATFFFASALGRPVRFFAVAALIYFLGPPVKRIIDRYFNLLSVAFVVLLVLGFGAIKLVGGGSGAGEPDPAGPASPYAEICGAPELELPSGAQ